MGFSHFYSLIDDTEPVHLVPDGRVKASSNVLILDMNNLMFSSATSEGGHRALMERRCRKIYRALYCTGCSIYAVFDGDQDEQRAAIKLKRMFWGTGGLAESSKPFTPGSRITSDMTDLIFSAPDFELHLNDESADCRVRVFRAPAEADPVIRKLARECVDKFATVTIISADASLAVGVPGTVFMGSPSRSGMSVDKANGKFMLRRVQISAWLKKLNDSTATFTLLWGTIREHDMPWVVALLENEAQVSNLPNDPAAVIECLKSILGLPTVGNRKRNELIAAAVLVRLWAPPAINSTRLPLASDFVEIMLAVRDAVNGNPGPFFHGLDLGVEFRGVVITVRADKNGSDYAISKDANGDTAFIPPNVFQELKCPRLGAMVTVYVRNSDKGLVAQLPRAGRKRECDRWGLNPKQLSSYLSSMVEQLEPKVAAVPSESRKALKHDLREAGWDPGRNGPTAATINPLQVARFLDSLPGRLPGVQPEELVPIASEVARRAAFNADLALRAPRFTTTWGTWAEGEPADESYERRIAPLASLTNQLKYLNDIDDAEEVEEEGSTALVPPFQDVREAGVIVDSFNAWYYLSFVSSANRERGESLGVRGGPERLRSFKLPYGAAASTDAEVTTCDNLLELIGRERSEEGAARLKRGGILIDPAKSSKVRLQWEFEDRSSLCKILTFAAVC